MRELHRSMERKEGLVKTGMRSITAQAGRLARLVSSTPWVAAWAIGTCVAIAEVTAAESVAFCA